jgi:hypothetical protein
METIPFTIYPDVFKIVPFFHHFENLVIFLKLYLKDFNKRFGLMQIGKMNVKSSLFYTSMLFSFTDKVPADKIISTVWMEQLTRICLSKKS